MANEPVNGSDIILQYDTTNGVGIADWNLVACGTESGIDGTVETIDATSKCGPAQLPGTLTETYNFTGFMAKNPAADTVSINEMRAIFKAKTIGHWRSFDQETAGATYYRGFFGAITTFNETTNQNEAVGFNLVISITGNTVDVLPVS